MERIAKKIIDRSEPVPFSGCWVWIGSVDKDGYGRIGLNGKRRSAHRLSYTVFRGKPKNFVCHTCDVPACVNPDHLYDGTNSQNMQDRSRRGRAAMARGEQHGHAVLTWDQVRGMRKMRESGKSLRQIANAFGMTNTGHVSNIVNHKIWKE